MNHDEMLAALAALMEQAEGPGEGPPGITTRELALTEGYSELPRYRRRQLNQLLDRGLVTVVRGIRYNRLGEVHHPPVYTLTDEGRAALEQLSK